MNIQNKPWMSEEETNLILSFINKNDIMLEYGCGGSTLFLPNYVDRYYSIESDQLWADLVKKNIPKNAKIYTIPTTRPEDQEQREMTKWNQLYTTKTYFAYKEYIETASLINRKITKVLIDGRARPQCARYIFDLLDEDAILFFHDWHPSRRWYKTILEKYEIIKTIDKGQMLAVLKKK